MKTKGRNPMAFYTIAVVGLFLAGFFLLVVFGAKSYSNTAAMQSEHMEMRALSAYIATSVKECDAEDAVQEMQGPEGPALVIADGDTGYAKRIFLSGGELMEDYALMEDEINLEEANPIAETKVFEIERPAENLLLVTTDEGTTRITLRSEGGEGHE